MKIKPKKSLGQNFLTDEGIIQKIISDANLAKEDVVLEIGPGKGVLTEALSKICADVIAVEIDERLVILLKERFKNNNKVKIFSGDVLKIDLSEIFTSYDLPVTGYKVIANIPYYITSPIIRKFLESPNPPQEMILMVQKEVAERIVAEPGEMSILAISVQYYATAEILFYVPKTAFDPVPEVDSAIIRIVPYIPRPSWGEGGGRGDVDNFFGVVRAGFCAKRKTLANNLANSLHLERKEIEAKLDQIGLASNVRAQELSVDDWKMLAKIL